MVTAVQATGSYILPANERVYRTSNLLGEWKGSWDSSTTFTFKVLKIKDKTADVEYIHNGKTERGTATIDKNIITYANVSVASRDGKQGVLLFEQGTSQKHTTILKSAPVATRS